MKDTNSLSPEYEDKPSGGGLPRDCINKSRKIMKTKKNLDLETDPDCGFIILKEYA